MISVSIQRESFNRWPGVDPPHREQRRRVERGKLQGDQNALLADHDTDYHDAEQDVGICKCFVGFAQEICISTFY